METLKQLYRRLCSRIRPNPPELDALLWDHIWNLFDDKNL